MLIKTSRFGRRTGIVLFLAIVLPVLLIAAFSYVRTQRSLTAQTLSRRQTIAQLASVAFAERLGLLKSIGVSLATRVQFRKWIEDGKWDAAIQIMRDTPKAFPMIDRVFITDPDGVLRADTPSDPGVKGLSFRHRDWYRGVSDHWQPYISDIYERMAEPRYAVVATAVPVTDELGKVKGILVIQVKLDRIFDWLKTIDAGPSGSVYFVDRSGTAAGLSWHSEYASVPPVQKVLQGGSGIDISYNPVAREEQVAAYEPVDGYGWGAVAQQPTWAAFAPQRSSLRLLLLVYGFVAAVTWATALLVLRLISDLKRSEEEARRAGVFVESVLEHIPDTILVKEAKGLRVARVNQSGEEMLGLAREELVEKTDYDIFPADEAAKSISSDRAVLASGKPLDISEERVHTSGKGERLLHTTRIPIFDSSGHPEYLLRISDDITEQKRAEEDRLLLAKEQAARAEAEKGVALRDDFISVASHELRTPLAALRLQLQMIPKLLAGVAFDSQERMFALLRKSLQQMDQFTQLVDDLLEVSRMREGQLARKPEPMDLSAMVRRVVDRHRAEWIEAGCRVNEDLQEKVIGFWDPVQMEQVVENLLANAIKYGAGKPIDILTRVEGSVARLDVRDRGIGVAKEDRAKIFERFERVAPITKYRGLGLGLFIVKQIVEAHGGTVRVESEGVGFGSTFRVELPLRPPGNGHSVL